MIIVFTRSLQELIVNNIYNLNTKSLCLLIKIADKNNLINKKL